MSNFALCFLFIFIFISCSSSSSNPVNIDSGIVQYNYDDKNGNFKYVRQTNLEKNTGRLLTKHQLEILNSPQLTILEQSVAVSNPGSIKGKKIALRPEEAQYAVWFEGKKYTSTLKLAPKKKAFELRTTGPGTKDNKTEILQFPKNQNIYCFFTQLTECLNFHGFISKAIKEESGSVRLNLIWNGYPYFQEAYNDLPMELFSVAKFVFDGKTNADEFRFNLIVGNQTIFFILSAKSELKKMFWVAQGVSMVRKDLKEQANE